MSFAPSAQAKYFKNSYVSFKLPDRWDCYLEQTAWVCRYKLDESCKGRQRGTKACQLQLKKTKEALIILTAKQRGAQDDFKIYQYHLKKTRPIITNKGKRSHSQVIHAKTVSIQKHPWVDGMHLKTVSIQKHPWVDGMHLGSEIPHYYTRYLATIKGDVAMLVTFSAHKLYYTKYSKDFFSAIKSLRVLADQTSDIQKNEIMATKQAPLGFPTDVDIPDDMNEPNSSEGSGSSLFVILAIALLALGGFIWFKNRNS